MIYCYYASCSLLVYKRARGQATELYCPKFSNILHIVKEVSTSMERGISGRMPRLFQLFTFQFWTVGVLVNLQAYVAC